MKTRCVALAVVASPLLPALVWASELEATPTTPSLGASALKAVLMLLVLAVGSVFLKRAVKGRWSGAVSGSVSAKGGDGEVTVVGRIRAAPGVELVTIKVWGEEVLLSVSPQGAHPVLRRGAVSSKNDTERVGVA